MGWNVCWRCAVLVALAWAAVVLGYGLHDPWTHDWPVLWMAGAAPIVLLFLAATIGELFMPRKGEPASNVAYQPPGDPRR